MKRAGFFTMPALCASLLCTSSAFAFCRTTTCDPSDPKAGCKLDADGCVTTGFPIAWRSSCVTIGVQQMGDPKDGLTFDDVAPVVEQAFGTWMQADCGNGTPSIEVNLIGPIECGVSEYNSKVGNANVVIFRSGRWPYPGAANAIGLTTTRFDTKTGDLWDADIELNGENSTFSIGDASEGDDLLSVLTHEGGHFLGLAHSQDQMATMYAFYNAGEMRTLGDDDVAGICSIYPPGRTPATTSCENRHGFSSQCGADQPPPPEAKGCSLNARAGVSGATRTSLQSSLSLLALVAGALSARLARRRRIV